VADQGHTYVYLHARSQNSHEIGDHKAGQELWPSRVTRTQEWIGLD
jgi:hypothetical protein